MDITNNERMKLATSAYRAYIKHAAEMGFPLTRTPERTTSWRT